MISISEQAPINLLPKLYFLHSIGADAETHAINTGIAAPAIRATHLISIPYGFQTPLPILDAGREVKASGHGGCTAGEQVTVAITITQSTSGAIATGENEHTCTGQLQTWSSVVTADTPSDFVDGTGEACGFATSRDGSIVTDTYEWCRDVVLATLDEQIHLPMIVTNGISGTTLVAPDWQLPADPYRGLPNNKGLPGAEPGSLKD